MEESLEYKNYRTLCPIPSECVLVYENAQKPADEEMRVTVFGRTYKTSRKGMILRINRNLSQPITSLNQIEGLEKLEKLTTLDLSNQSLKNIYGLEKFQNLRNLYIRGESGLDLKPLEKILTLEKLVIQGAKSPKNIQSVGKLKNLRSLNLSWLDLLDISFLSGLTKLVELELQGNGIKDISVLAKLTKLSTLKLNRNQIQDISALKNLQALDELDLEDNKITAVDALDDSRRLRTLYLRGNLITDYWVLEKLCDRCFILPLKEGWPPKVVAKANPVQSENHTKINNELKNTASANQINRDEVFDSLVKEWSSKSSAQKAEEPVKIVEPVKKAEPVKIVEPVKKAEPAKPIASVKKEEPVKPVEPAKKTESIIDRLLSIDPEELTGDIDEDEILSVEFEDLFTDYVKADSEANTSKVKEVKKVDEQWYFKLLAPRKTKSGIIFKKYKISMDCIWFGKYPQKKESNGSYVTEAICWRVLDVKDGVATLLSDVILDCAEFELKKTASRTINPVSVRYNFILLDLNKSFYEVAFCEKEREALLVYPDAVNLLDYEHIVDSTYTSYGFNDFGKVLEKTCLCNYSDYACSKGLNPNYRYGNWLIIPNGLYKKKAFFVNEFGMIDKSGIKTKKIVGIRPLIFLDLKKTGKLRYEQDYIEIEV